MSNALIRKVIKYIFNEFLWAIDSLFYGLDAKKKYSHLHPLRVFRIGFIQKIIGINRHVPWPVHPTTEVISPENIQKGSYTPGLSMGCFLDGRNGIIIEENVWIGPRVSLISQDHENLNYNRYKKEGPIIIKKNSLLCANSIILPGVLIGAHTIVAAGAVVTRRFPDGNQILAGNPANIIKKIDSYCENKSS